MHPRVNVKTYRDSQTHVAAVATAPAFASFTGEQITASDRRWRVLKVDASYATGTTAGVLTIATNAGAHVLWEVSVPPSSAIQLDFVAMGGLRGDAGMDVTATLTDGGAGILGKVNLAVAVEQ